MMINRDLIEAKLDKFNTLCTIFAFHGTSLVGEDYNLFTDRLSPEDLVEEKIDGADFLVGRNSYHTGEDEWLLTCSLAPNGMDVYSLQLLGTPDFDVLQTAAMWFFMHLILDGACSQTELISKYTTFDAWFKSFLLAEGERLTNFPEPSIGGTTFEEITMCGKKVFGLAGPEKGICLFVQKLI